MAGIINAIFLAATGVGLVPVTEGFIKQAQGTKYAVTIGVGSNSNKAASLSGNAPGVSLWTAEGEAIGGVFGTKQILGDASAFEIDVAGNPSIGGGKAPAEYLSVTNGGTDAICISYVGVVDPLNNKRLFVGDVAKNCGADWFPSDLLVGDARPSCFWLDRDFSNGLRFQGVGIHLPSFSNAQDGSIKGLAQEYQTNSDTMCKSGPRFRMYDRLETEDPILRFDPPFLQTDFNSDGSDVDTSRIINNPGVLTNINMDLANRACESPAGCPNIHDKIAGPGVQGPGKLRRSSSDQTHQRKARQQSFSDSLVVSHHPEHSADEVCASDTSRGPDFISMAEMKYCDMETKISWDICSDSTTHCCFNLDGHQMKPCGARGTVAARKALPHKSYSDVRHWGKDQ